MAVRRNIGFTHAGGEQAGSEQAAGLELEHKFGDANVQSLRGTLVHQEDGYLLAPSVPLELG